MFPEFWRAIETDLSDIPRLRQKGVEQRKFTSPFVSELRV
jgi:hypothetical protein